MLYYMYVADAFLESIKLSHGEKTTEFQMLNAWQNAWHFLNYFYLTTKILYSYTYSIFIELHASQVKQQIICIRSLKITRTDWDLEHTENALMLIASII